MFLYVSVTVYLCLYNKSHVVVSLRKSLYLDTCTKPFGLYSKFAKHGAKNHGETKTKIFVSEKCVFITKSNPEVSLRMSSRV